MVTEAFTGRRGLIEALRALNDPTTISVVDPHLFASCLVHDVGDAVTVVTDRSTFGRVTAVEYLSWILAQRQGDTIEVGVTDDPRAPMAAVGSDGIIGLVAVDHYVVGVVTDEDESVQTAVAQRLDRLAKSAAPAEVTGQTLDAVAAGFADRFGDAAAEQYLDCLAAAWPGQLAEKTIDASHIAVLVAANHGGLLADLGTWGRQFDVGTKADFSRIKRELVEADIVTTTPETHGVGRPRHRLGLDHTVLEATSDARVRPVVPCLCR